MKKHLLTNSKNEGSLTKQDKAFTLIELLAIIVILAIIVVITVPIILNIIENSKKGAAQDSAYGFKDSINKYYVDALSENKNLKLEGEYTILDGNLTGKFEGPESTSKTVTILISGEKPSSGSLHYTNSVLDGGYLVIGDYKVTFNQDGKIGKTEKNIGSFSNEQVSGNLVSSCPGCVFGRSSDVSDYTDIDSFVSDSCSEDYYCSFLGLLLNNNEVVKSYACLAKPVDSNFEYYCIEGSQQLLDDDTNNQLYIRNKEVVCTMDSACLEEEIEYFNEFEYGTRIWGGLNENALIAYTNGFVYSGDAGYDCNVYPNGSFECYH